VREHLDAVLAGHHPPHRDDQEVVHPVEDQVDGEAGGARPRPEVLERGAGEQRVQRAAHDRRGPPGVQAGLKRAAGGEDRRLDRRAVRRALAAADNRLAPPPREDGPALSTNVYAGAQRVR